jgi:hypothetical protein
MAFLLQFSCNAPIALPLSLILASPICFSSFAEGAVSFQVFDNALNFFIFIRSS